MGLSVTTASHTPADTVLSIGPVERALLRTASSRMRGPVRVPVRAFEDNRAPRGEHTPQRRTHWVEPLSAADPLVVAGAGDSGAELRQAVAAPLPTGVEALTIERFRPDMPEETWSVIADSVRAWVAECDAHGMLETRRLLGIVSQHVRWCWETAGLPLDKSVVFRHQIVAEFIDSGLPNAKPATRGSYRSTLMNAADILLEGTQVIYRPPKLPDSDPACPYTASEITLLRYWAAGQATERRRIDATLLLALSLGAGLSTNEVMLAQAKHVTVDDAGVLIQVTGDRPRIVPVLAEWEETIAAIAQAAWRPDLYLFRPTRRNITPNSVYNFVHRSNSKPFQISVQRLRATWLVTHLSSDTPVRALLAASGITTLKGLDRYLPFAPEADVATSRAALRRRAATEAGEPR